MNSSHTPPTRPTAHQAHGGEHAIPKRQNPSRVGARLLVPAFSPTKKNAPSLRMRRFDRVFTPPLQHRHVRCQPSRRKNTPPRPNANPFCRPTPGSPSLLFFYTANMRRFDNNDNNSSIYNNSQDGSNPNCLCRSGVPTQTTDQSAPPLNSMPGTSMYSTVYDNRTFTVCSSSARSWNSTR